MGGRASRNPSGGNGQLVLKKLSSAVCAWTGGRGDTAFLALWGKGRFRVYEEKVAVQNVPGIHARPAALLVQRASLYQSDIFFATDHLTVNGKSIMGVMMLAAETGTMLTVRAEGVDEKEAVEALVKLVAGGFKEG